MPKRKRKSTASHKSQNEKAWQSLDEELQTKIERVLSKVPADDAKKDEDLSLVVSSYRDIFERELQLQHVDDKDLTICLESKSPPEALRNLAASLHLQQLRAELAFSKLDGVGKQCVVAEDILRIAHDLDIQMTESDAEEMIDFCGSGDLVDFASFLKIARMANL